MHFSAVFYTYSLRSRGVRLDKDVLCCYNLFKAKMNNLEKGIGYEFQTYYNQ